ncbi:uncharacterized protein LOC106666601 [Cimex lectularius]|uniref:Uncharacterized protein n=1 Tax=Cimex lectularius TaxID=79782 RepID=A0A8I6SMH3_CIMLE|nr:uncharacterized protein LOC106666601 [Cimex lectularius]
MKPNNAYNNITKKEDDSWPSIQDIIDQVHKNISHWRREEAIDYNWPYYFHFPTFDGEIDSTTEEPRGKTRNTPSPPSEDFMSKFVFRKIDTSSLKQAILAISVRKSGMSRKRKQERKEWTQVTTTPVPTNNRTRHLRRLHEHLKALSAAKARLHHRWLQKEKIQSKLLT